MKTDECGVLLTNIGSPDAPTPAAVRTYLKKFLSDKRVVNLPRIIWWPILYGLILRTRPAKSAALYQKIWTEQGSPLTTLSQQLAEKLQVELNIPIEVGMHYGNPTIKYALEKLQKRKLKKILILPLFPQYSTTTTAASFDQIAAVVKQWRTIPEIIHLNNYHAQNEYINAIHDSIPKESLNHLLFSFHGIPNQLIKRGDPYAEQCHKTAELIAQKLQLPKEKWSISFQSRLGKAKWLMPYTDKVLAELPIRHITDLHVICPGFAVDCLETLEEIAIRGQEQFLRAGGKSFQYISALNVSEHQISLLRTLIEGHLEAG